MNTLRLRAVHHVAIICSNYTLSKKFYTEVLGYTILAEHYREERHSFKLDLALSDRYTLELFSFPGSPPRVSQPEACGLRHLAFEVECLAEAIETLGQKGVQCEPVRTDHYTGKRFTFFTDPDSLPLELYEK